ncbi:DUF2975 domain-containing protein [Marinobacter nauticus]|jgi:hypothetical protein|uniref:DUF2975 domain-containing protein n=1 Tax=Marinobacter nauticus TaxID=2743 RepID=UPI000256F0DD|nr:DUF2975 domain-containing protein [Marinobacter nauticus]TPW24489.1 DUF2975 domain-containing protein [Marinobacter nauticus]CCG96357.1 conserved hypothetical protein; putative membrane protein [Marinobacter nauticus ATCC 49840]
MENIQKYSRRVRRVLQGLFILAPLLTLYYWLTVNTGMDALFRSGIIETDLDPMIFASEPLTMTTRFLAFLASMLPCGILMYALQQLIHLFRHYENQEIFTLATATHYQKLGYVFFYWAAGAFLYSGLISVILSFNNPPGERVLSLTFTGIDLLSILCGFVVLIISWVMKEAQKIADEHMHTV